MAWTQPASVSVAEMIDAAWMNTYVRDNLSALDAHTHTGAAGDGNDVMIGIDSITTDDIADPSAPGANKNIIWTNTGTLHQRAGAAGSAEELSITTHTHP